MRMLCVGLVLGVGVAAGLWGCVAAAAGAAAGYGVVEYQNGLYTVAVPATMDRAWRATLVAMDQLGAEVKGKSRETTSGFVRARLPDQTDIEITVGRGLSGDFTRLSIQVGLFGDEPRSKMIAARIREALE